MDIVDFCKEIPFWEFLSESEKSFVAENSFIKTFDKNEMLYNKADLCLGIVHIISGNIRAYIVSDEGREITLFRIKSNENCVLSASCVINQITFETNIVADENSQALILNSCAFQNLMQSNIYVKCYVYEFLIDRFSHIMWVMQSILFQHFDQRLASYFINYYDKTGNTNIKMTQERIATDVNSAREVVSRMLKQFASDGLIEIKRGMIVLKNIDALRNII